MEKGEFPLWKVRLAQAVVWPIIWALGGMAQRGRSRLPKRGGVLLLPNHRSDLDPILLQFACPRHIVFMSKSELDGMPVVAYWRRAWWAFSVRRGEPDRPALRTAVDHLQKGRVVCVFPEGELSESGEMLPLKPGIALIARQAGVVAQCVGIEGAARWLPYGSRVPRPAFRKVTIRWGEPFLPDRSEGTDVFLGRVNCEIQALTSGFSPSLFQV